MLSIFMIVLMLVGTVNLFYVSGFATEEAAVDIKNIGSKIYNFILGISTVLAVVAEAVAACMYFFSSNGKTVEMAGNWMKKIALGWVAINCMGIIVSLFTGFFTGYQWIAS